MLYGECYAEIVGTVPTDFTTVIRLGRIIGWNLKLD